MNKHFEPYCHSTSQCKWTLYLSESVLNKYFSRWNEEDHWGRSQEVKTGWLVESRGNSWRRSVTGSGCIATAAWSSSLWCSALTVIVTPSWCMSSTNKPIRLFRIVYLLCKWHRAWFVEFSRWRVYRFIPSLLDIVGWMPGRASEQQSTEVLSGRSSRDPAKITSSNRSKMGFYARGHVQCIWRHMQTLWVRSIILHFTAVVFRSIVSYH